MDYLIHDTICKHIHLVKMWTTSKDLTTGEMLDDDTSPINKEFSSPEEMVNPCNMNCDITSLKYLTTNVKHGIDLQKYRNTSIKLQI